MTDAEPLVSNTEPDYLLRLMYSHSKKWVAPRVRENEERKRLNMARDKFCPRSSFWTYDFDIAQHRKDMQADRQHALEKKSAREQHDAAQRHRLGLPPTPKIKPAFGGKQFSTNHSPVLCLPTIFTPWYDAPNRGKDIAAWPNKAEMKYEGDERIATEEIHRRFLGPPRVAGNETVTWMQRSLVGQYPLDDFYYPLPHPVEIFLRTHYVDELEFSDQEGMDILGEDLMKALDHTD